MKIYELKESERLTALNTIIKELERLDIKLNINNSADRQRAYVLANNLRIEFNKIGGLA